METCVLGAGSQYVQAGFSWMTNIPALSTRLMKSPPDFVISARSELHDAAAHRESSLQKFSTFSYARRRAAVNELQHSSDFSNALDRAGMMLEVEDLNMLLRHFSKVNRWKDLLQLFEWMQKHGRVSVPSYSSYIKCLGRHLCATSAVKFYNSIEDKSIRNNVVVCNSAISCLMNGDKFESGVKLFQHMKRAGVVPDIVTYNTLLAGCMKIKQGFSIALDLVQELQFKGLHMDYITYATLLAICASNHQPIEAEKIFQQMQEEGQIPNIFHYSALLNAYSGNGFYKKADSLLENLKSAGLATSKVILTTLLKVYVKAHKFERSKELLNQLETLGYAEDEMPYCLLMDGLAKAGYIDDAKSVFDNMKARNVKPDGYSYNIMISSYCRNKLLGDAKQLAREFEAANGNYDIALLNSILRAFCKSGDMGGVMKTLKKLDDQAICPDWKTFDILIKFYCKHQMYLLAYKVVVDMHSMGLLPGETRCLLLIHLLGATRSCSEAFFVYNLLRYGKRTICKAIHEKMVKILLAGRLLREAYTVIKDHASLISQSTTEIFATAFVKHGERDLINGVLKTLHLSGYTIGQKQFQFAIKRYMGNPARKDLLRQLLLWMPKCGYDLDSTITNAVLWKSQIWASDIVAEALLKQ